MCALSSAARKAWELWQKEPFDEETRRETAELMQHSESAVEDCFGSSLRFGTAGMRGLMGVGPNRLNAYTIAAAAEGLAIYLQDKVHQERPLRALIGYDSRHHSREFAITTAQVLANHGIEVFIFADIRPIPMVSFGTRYLGCSAGVMITASHNPAEYNGFKVFWSNAAQVVPPHDEGIVDEVNGLKDPWSVALADITSPLIHWIDDELDDDYCAAIDKLQNYPEKNRDNGKDLKVIYSSLHGTGSTVIRRILESWGFSNLHLVEKQCIPDGSFPTASFPNPEKPEATALARDMLRAEQGDIMIVNDPDADRIGVGCLHQGEVRLFTGNEMACLCLDYLCNAWQQTRPHEVHLGAIKTIVTTEAFRAIAQRHAVECHDVLTGFKFIGNLIDQWERAGEPTYIYGGEESYGALYGTYARDKDGISMAALVCEMALHYKQSKMDLAEVFDALESEIGVYKNANLNIEFPDTEEGHERMASMMKRLREQLPQQVAGRNIVKVKDYLTQKEKDLVNKRSTDIEGLPAADVIHLIMDDNSAVIVRPSGTEPKVKLYGSVLVALSDDVNLDQARQKASAEVERLLKDTSLVVKAGASPS